MKRRTVVLLAGAAVLLAGALAYWRLTAEPPRPAAGPPAASPPEPADRALRRLLTGVWQDEYQGKRTMTLKEDGTGTMHVELAGLKATLFARELRFDMEWSLDGKVLRKRTVGGEPADKVNLILNTLGDTAEDTILEATEGRLLLLDRDGKTRYDWKRVPSDPTPAANP